jgi:hypothetical protein
VKSLKPLSDQQALRVQHVRITDARVLEWVKAFARFSTYDAVMILAHGSPLGLEAAEGVTMSWSEVATALEPMKPRFLLAVACFGALSAATDALFEGIPSLECVVSSPAPLTITQARAAVFELAFAACRVPLPSEFSNLIAVLNAMTTKGVLYRRTREGRATSTPSERATEDLLGWLLWAALRELDSDDEELTDTRRPTVAA